MDIKIEKCNENTIKLIISCEDLINGIEYSISLYFSDTILMAIKDTDKVYYVSKNIYTNKLTFIRNAGKFLDTIEPNKDNRLRRDIFEKKVQAIIDNLIVFNPYN